MSKQSLIKNLSSLSPLIGEEGNDKDAFLSFIPCACCGDKENGERHEVSAICREPISRFPDEDEFVMYFEVVCTKCLLDWKA